MSNWQYEELDEQAFRAKWDEFVRVSCHPGALTFPGFGPPILYDEQDGVAYVLRREVDA